MYVYDHTQQQQHIELQSSSSPVSVYDNTMNSCGMYTRGTSFSQLHGGSTMIVVQREKHNHGTAVITVPITDIKFRRVFFPLIFSGLPIFCTSRYHTTNILAVHIGETAVSLPPLQPTQPSRSVEHGAAKVSLVRSAV